MPTRWQKYIKKRLNKLIDKTNFSEEKSRRVLYRFVNFYWRSISRVFDFQEIIEKLQLEDNHLKTFVKASKRLMFDSNLTDHRIAKIITTDEKLWSKIDPENRWWTVFQFLPFVKNIIRSRQEKLKQRSPFYGAKIEGKSLYDYFLDNQAEEKQFEEGVSDSIESNQALVNELLSTMNQVSDLYYIVINASQCWDSEIRKLILYKEKNLQNIKDMITVEDAKKLLDEFEFLKDNKILNNIIEKSKQHLPQQSENDSSEASSVDVLSKSLTQAIKLQSSLEGGRLAHSVDPGTPPEVNSPSLRSSEEDAAELQQKQQSEFIKQSVTQANQALDSKIPPSKLPAPEFVATSVSEEAPKEKSTAVKLGEGLTEADPKEFEATIIPQLQHSVEQSAEPLEPIRVKQVESHHPYEHVKLKDYEWNKNTSLYKHVRDTSHERNSKAENQFARVVDYIGKNLENPGPENDGFLNGPLAANILKKWMFAIAHCDVAYKRKGQWNWFSQPHDNKEVPVAGIISGVVRMTIEFDHPDTAKQFFHRFLWEEKPYARAAATHGAIELPKPEELSGINMSRHFIETKPSLITAGAYAAYLKMTSMEEGHYGINLALGGYGNKHYLSGREIDNKGENGHIYMYYLPQGAVLIGIEQSAPSDCAAPEVKTYFGSVYDNVGGGHDMMGTPNDFGPVGNDCFAKKPKGHEEEGVTQYGPDEYYKSMHMFINSAQLNWITENFPIRYSELQIDQKPLGTIRDLKSTLDVEDFVEIRVPKSISEDVLDIEEEAVFLSNDSSIDDEYSQRQIANAIKLLKDYLLLRHNSTEESAIKNCNKVTFLIEQLSQIRNIGHFIEIINEIEIIKIASENNASIVDLMDHGFKLSEQVRRKYNLHEKEGDMHSTILPGFWNNPVEYFWHTGSELKKTLMQVHENLIEIVPQEMKEQLSPGLNLK